MALKCNANSDNISQLLIGCTSADPLNCHTWIFAALTAVARNGMSKQFEVCSTRCYA